MSEASDRAAFEQWTRDTSNDATHKDDFLRDPKYPDEYSWVLLQHNWEIWQAATARERERASRECDKLAAGDHDGSSTAEDCASAIRRGEA